MIPYRLSDFAEADLRAIFWQGLERFGPNQTERYLSELEDLFAHLGRYPDACRLRSDLVPPVRVCPHGAHVILYEQSQNTVVILRIRSARENWLAAPLGDAPS